MIVNNGIKLIDSAVSVDSISETGRLPTDATSLIVEVNGTGEFAVRIEMSPNGTDWYGINELDVFAADSVQSISDSMNIFRKLRAKIDIGANGGSVTVCSVHFRDN